jgi:SAM-dependent methyltransferase
MDNYIKAQKRFTDSILTEWATWPDREEFHITRLKKIAKYMDQTMITKAAILDLGCRTGHLLEAFRDLGYKDLTGIEISPRAVKICKGRGLNVYEGDIHELDCEKNQFDLVLAIHVLEHCHDPAAALNEISRVIKRGGLLVVEMPIQEPQEVPTQFEHYYIFDHSDKVDVMIERAAFTKVETKVESWGYGAIFKKK